MLVIVYLHFVQIATGLHPKTLRDLDTRNPYDLAAPDQQWDRIPLARRDLSVDQDVLQLFLVLESQGLEAVAGSTVPDRESRWIGFGRQGENLETTAGVGHPMVTVDSTDGDGCARFRQANRFSARDLLAERLCRHALELEPETLSVQRRFQSVSEADPPHFGEFGDEVLEPCAGDLAAFRSEAPDLVE
ncbi:MAG: hypothetical protein R3338_03385, partial [Thermoanaerobaculia bacterium]|nr:hypothetical protein [Thermoanaerobaculia bacterium]